MLTAIDLFAGAGGFTTGAAKAGIEVVWAANHNPLAVHTHSLNHPKVIHSCQDLQLADWNKVPNHDLCMASPCCQGHSRAKGVTKGWSEKSRQTAMCVHGCAARRRPRAIIVENVTEFLDWSESDDKRLKGSVYRAWRELICTIGPGYHYSDVILDAADVGVPQNRKRLFMVFVRADVCSAPIPLNIPSKSHTSARKIILPLGRNQAWTPLDRLRSDRTRGFIKRSSGRFKGDMFLVPYYGGTLETGFGRSLDRPLGTVTTKDRYGLVSPCHRWLRMLTLGEYRAAMAFPKSYRLPERHQDALEQLGNAVCPPVAQYIVQSVARHLAA